MSATPVQVPKLSIAVDEGTLVEWIVADGQTVAEGDPLYLIETDKVQSEVYAPTSGVVHWTGELGETYPAGTQIGHIDPAS